MKISLNTIRFANKQNGSAGDPAPEGIDALIAKIGAQLAAVEEVTFFGERFEGVLIVKVISCQPHPNAEKLKVCKVDDGKTAEGVARDAQGLIEVVCGAPNVHEGMLAAWIPPGGTVAGSLGKEGELVLEARDIRGVVSNGMLASAKELAISDNHAGILEVDVEVPPGTSFAKAYNLVGEAVIEMENKMFTHRPDCFGQLGIARELEGIQHRPYKSPDWYTQNPTLPEIETTELPLEVRNEVPDLVPRFSAIAMGGVTVKPSPVWLQIFLTEMGIRPINNIVDYTNFFMLETGQPLHAYDYDKVKAQATHTDKATIVVRHPKEGEQITLLGGKELKPRKEAIMIASASELIGVGGVMGGADTEVDENTMSIILECANFDMYSIRRTAMEHGLFTDAVTRFTKGQSPLQTLAVLAKIVDEIRQFAGGKVASGVQDVQSNLQEPANVSVAAQFVNDRLGLKLAAEEMVRLLQNVEFDVQLSEGQLVVTPPFWRTDIHIGEDIVEEVGRLYGYDHLPLVLPGRDLSPAKRNDLLEFKDKLRTVFAKSGANELLTYSFVHGDLLDKVGQDRENAFQLSNALSPDLQYYRQSLMPSLLEKVHPNVKAGFDEFAIFEINQTHRKDLVDKETGLPIEEHHVAFVFAAEEKRAAAGYKGAPYYQAARYLNEVLASIGIQPVFEPLADADSARTDAVLTPFEPVRAATVKTGKGQIIGYIGEFKASVRRKLKLPPFSAGFELDVQQLLKLRGKKSPYVPLPRFPKVEQDISLKVPATMNYQELFGFVRAELTKAQPEHTFFTLQPVDIYQRENDPGHKQITLRLTIAAYDRTLTSELVNDLLDSVAAAAHASFGAERM